MSPTATPCLIDPSMLCGTGAIDPMPLAIVDLDAADRWPFAVRLPPFPVIGIGDPAHPLATSLDAVVEAPVTIDAIAANVIRRPQAAATLVQVLRACGAMPVDQALMVESMAYAMLQASAGHRAWLAAQPARAPLAAGRLVVRRDGRALDIVIDRPASRNAIDRALRDDLFAAFTLAALDRDIAQVRLRSTGTAFCIGAELAEFGTTRDPAEAHRIRALTLPAHPLSQCADSVDVHIQGACIGSGLEMAAFAGRVTAARSAWFQLPELAMGVIPGAGGCVSVPRRIGRHRTALMVLSGRRIDAATALRWGLIDAIMDEPPTDPGRADFD